MGQVTEPGTWLDQAWTEWVLVISGAAAILFEEEAEPHQLKAGDYLMIEPHCRHRVTWTKEKRADNLARGAFWRFARDGRRGLISFL